MRIHKVVKDSQGNEIKICGANRWQMIHSNFINDDEIEHFVMHYGIKYSLDEFIATRRSFSNHPDWLKEFDGYMSDSFFSGVLIKLSNDGEAAKVFTYLS